MAKFNCNFISYILHRTVDITVVVPSVTIPQATRRHHAADPCMHTPKENYPVLYLLHGFGNNHATWTGYTNVELYAEERQIAVVCISAENKAYITSGDDDFFRFLAEEVPDFVCGMFPISREPQHTYIAGLSMGGFGTLVHALSFPERFAAFGTFSAAVRLRPAGLDLDPDKAGSYNLDEALQDDSQVQFPQFDPKMLAQKLAREGKPFPKAYISCGGADKLLKCNEQFRDVLTGMGADVTWDVIPGYGHEWRFWDIEVERFLDWLPRTDSYAKAGKRKV